MLALTGSMARAPSNLHLRILPSCCAMQRFHHKARVRRLAHFPSHRPACRHPDIRAIRATGEDNRRRGRWARHRHMKRPPLRRYLVQVRRSRRTPRPMCRTTEVALTGVRRLSSLTDHCHPMDLSLRAPLNAPSRAVRHRLFRHSICSIATPTCIHRFDPTIVPWPTVPEARQERGLSERTR